MDEISSTEFRKTYAKLTKPTMVTVSGHLIGVWNPSTPMTQKIAAAFDVPESEALTDEPSYVSARARAQLERDAFVERLEGKTLLRPHVEEKPIARVTGVRDVPSGVVIETERFNTQPFKGPIPKKGK